MLNLEPIYLDYQATTPLSNHAKSAIDHVHDTAWANPHSLDHSQGWQAARVVEDSKAQLATFIGALPEEVVAVSGATEANNLAIVGTGFSALRQEFPRRTIVISGIEHKCVIEAARFLQKYYGFQVVRCPVCKNGIIDLNAINELITEETLLVSIMAVNNEIGTVQPINEIGAICRSKGAIFHVDGAQALYSKINVVDENIDLLSLSSHKMYGPKGIGALYINPQAELTPSPMILGGGQQNDYRSGTIPTALLAGFAAAVGELNNKRAEEQEKLLILQHTAINRLKDAFPDCKVNGHSKLRHPGNLNITLPGIDAKALILRLQPHLSISTSSACQSGVFEPSHVLRAIGLTSREAECTVRISFGRFTTERELDLAVEMIISASDEFRSGLAL